MLLHDDGRDDLAEEEAASYGVSRGSARRCQAFGAGRFRHPIVTERIGSRQTRDVEDAGKRNPAGDRDRRHVIAAGQEPTPKTTGLRDGPICVM